MKKVLWLGIIIPMWAIYVALRFAGQAADIDHAHLVAVMPKVIGIVLGAMVFTYLYYKILYRITVGFAGKVYRDIVR